MVNLGNCVVSFVVFSLEHGGSFNLLDTVIFVMCHLNLNKEGGGNDKMIQKF